jgi:hypothetical protein
MKFNTMNKAEAIRASEYLIDLIDKGKVVEVKRISPKRSLNQNAYLHVIIAAFGLHFGYTSDEAKVLYKRFNKDIYVYKNRGGTFLRSSADLTKEEMAKSIDTFRKKSDELGYSLPPADDPGWLREVENAIEQARYFL